MRYFRVKHWDEMQHYKDRNPPWIKLYNTLLDDYEFSCLQDASKLHLIMIWLLASRNNNRLPLDSTWLKSRISAHESIDLDVLLKSGFIIEIIDENQPLQSVEQDASNVIALARSRETEQSRAETEKNTGGDNSPPCPHQEFIDAYHELLPMGTQVRVWNEERQKHLRARWREKPERQNIEWWRKFFAYVSESEFLTGQAQSTQGRDPFVVSLDWLINPQNFAKTIEGKYHRGTA